MVTTDELYIIGTGGHGAVVAEIAQLAGMAIAGFIDDDPLRVGGMMFNCKVLGGRDDIPRGAQVALGIGQNSIRARLIAIADARAWRLPIMIHPSAVVSPSARLGDGTVVMAQVVVNARAVIGRGCILNTAASVDHDCELGDTVHIAPGVRLAGNITIGDGSLLGIGSCVRPGITIGAWCTVGAGSVIVSDLPDNVTAFGNPAHIRAIA